MTVFEHPLGVWLIFTELPQMFVEMGIKHIKTLFFPKDLLRFLGRFPFYTSYPLVNSHITMENHHFSWVNPLEITISNSFLYVYQRVPQNIGRIIGSHVFGCQDFRSRRIQALLFGTINILGTPGTDG